MNETLKDLEEKLETVLGDTLRPIVEADGGSIEALHVSKERVVVRLGDACSGCPGVLYTRRFLIEPVLRAALGDAVEIEVQSNRTSQY